MLRHQLWPVLAVLVMVIACTLSKLTLAGSQVNIRPYSQLAGLSKCFEVWEQVLINWNSHEEKQYPGWQHDWPYLFFLGGGSYFEPFKPLTNWDKQIQTAANAQSKTHSLYRKREQWAKQRGPDKSEYMHPDWLYSNSGKHTFSQAENMKLRRC